MGVGAAPHALKLYYGSRTDAMIDAGVLSSKLSCLLQCFWDGWEQLGPVLLPPRVWLLPRLG